MRNHPPPNNHFQSILLSALLLGPPTLLAQDHHHRYEGDIHPTEAAPLWRESKKNGGGKATLDNGSLRLETSHQGRQFYVIDPPGGSDPSAGTVDFSIKVTAENEIDEPFGIRIGSGTGSINIVFRLGSIAVEGKTIEADCSVADVYRVFYSKDTFSLSSAKHGLLLEKARISPRYPADGISFGTRQSLNFSEPVSWDLDFIRWTYSDKPLKALKSE